MLLEEAQQRKSFLQDKIIKTVYIGGGTPSQLDIDELNRLVKGLSYIFDLSHVEEFTMEANPEDITSEYVSALPHSINRISMGVQSFVDEELQLLHRRHNAQKARQAVKILQQHGISNISIDLMYGLPTQSMESFAYSIEQALLCNTQHISAYNLQVEEDTVLARMVEDGTITVAEDDLCNQMNELLRTQLDKAGFVQYEISNYAKPGFHSRHNASYWDGTPYLGLGPGAHSYDGEKLREWNEPQLMEYLKGNRSYSSESLSEEELFNERIMLGLRTTQGVCIDSLIQMYLNNDKLQIFIDKGWISLSLSHFKLTSSGLCMADEVMRELFVESAD